MSETALLAAGLAFLMPLGYGLIALGGLPEDRARQAALSILAALGLATLGYLAIGFALQFGGIGLVRDQPGYERLIWEWSALGTTWGTGWGVLGLSGWGLSGAAANTAAYSLALANLPWVATVSLDSLGQLAWSPPRLRNWLAWAAHWGGDLSGGWQLDLGRRLAGQPGFERGPGTWACGPGRKWSGTLARRVFGLGRNPGLRPKGPRPRPGELVPLPPVHLPVLAVLGAGLLLVGNPAWMIANPLLDQRVIDLTQVTLNAFVAAAAGGLLPLTYSWFVAGTPDPLMAARGVAAGSIALAAAAPFVPPWAAFAIGGVAGLLIPLVGFLVDHVLCFDDPTAACTVHGLGGALGLLAVAVFADGRAGLGWNGVGNATYLGVVHQGVTGLFPAAGFQPDWPAQFHAQTVGVVALALFGFFAAWLVLAPPATLLHLLARARVQPPVGTAQRPLDAASMPDEVPSRSPGGSSCR